MSELKPDLTYSLARPAILVIDDDPVILTFVSLLLEDALTVLTATSAREGLAALQGDCNVSAVLLDIILPDMNGLEVLRRIRKYEKTSALNVVMLTASSQHAWVVKLANMDIQGYFEKPFDGTALRKKVINLCDDVQVPSYQALKDLWADDFTARIQSVGLTVKRALDYIEAHFQQECRRENIATHLDISADYLSRLFHKRCGLHLTEYITLCRLNLSREILVKHPGMKVKHVALHVGMADVDYFCKLFKKQSGFTPNKYRESLLDFD